ncbi:putative efflux protein, MATE family [Sphaerochaeta pleomorpha str. Grapes]|uniref:Multidrug-efflux transporter n=1 Tax=Sphaerochaeta pleomorpha (strain ATCC BAA-1885 / DSM 22778 / Grapes) TaxID=158190 RepID=G8QUX2_SPHPG|nr:MATE family efflux transporter [Sphaerochaeta pleomorpha]AEV28148.1 putative efflux protein, MATE family [Sphaerochaeta pleomorpha str. Grapes]
MQQNQTNSKNQVLVLALPVTLQSLFQSSLGIIDQLMVGQLGTESIAAVGMGSKFANLYTVSLAAIGTAASIMMAQYYGQKNTKGVSKAFFINTLYAFILMILFAVPALFFPHSILSLYTNESAVIPLASDYLFLIGLGFPPLLITMMLANHMRNVGYPNLPMVSGSISVVANTLLNFLLIFGSLGFPRLGLKGAAVATTFTRYLECVLLLLLFLKIQKKTPFKITWEPGIFRDFALPAFLIGLPVLVNEFLWGFGETVYAVIYGHMGTQAMAAMTLTFPVQGLSIGLFSGVSTAAAILIGNLLGKKEEERAYALTKDFMKWTVFGSLGLGMLLVLATPFYVKLFKVNLETYSLGVTTLKVFCVALWIKVSNMVLGGIVRSGGKTHYTLFLDMLGTWGIGVPLGFVAAFIWNLPLPWVYALITFEELVRFALGIMVIRTKKWMGTLR